MAKVIILIALLFFLGHALKWFFSVTKIPDLLILLGIGYGLKIWFKDDLATLDRIGPTLSTMALIVVLYGGGLSLRAKDLLTSSLPAFIISIIGFLSVFLLSVGVALAFGQTFETAMLLGAAIGSTSSAIVIPIVKKLSITNNTKIILSLESAFTDVLAIVIFLVLLDGATVIGSFSIEKLLMGIGPETLKAALYGVGGGLVWSFLKARFSFISNINFSGEAWAMLCYGFMEMMKLNGAIGVLALGFTLANLDLLPFFFKKIFNNNPVSRMDMHLLEEVTFLLKTAFFVFLGTQVQFDNYIIILIALILSIGIFILRYLAVEITMDKSKCSKVDAMIITAMGPRGLACAVLATLPLQRGYDAQAGEWLQNVIFALIPITIVFTAILVVFSEKPFFRKFLDRFFVNYS